MEFELIGKTRCAPASGIGLAIFIKGLSDDDQLDIILRGDLRDLRGIDGARDVLHNFERAGNGGGCIA